MKLKNSKEITSFNRLFSQNKIKNLLLNTLNGIEKDVLLNYLKNEVKNESKIIYLNYNKIQSHKSLISMFMAQAEVEDFTQIKGVLDSLNLINRSRNKKIKKITLKYLQSFLVIIDAWEENLEIEDYSKIFEENPNIKLIIIGDSEFQKSNNYNYFYLTYENLFEVKNYFIQEITKQNSTNENLYKYKTALLDNQDKFISISNDKEVHKDFIKYFLNFFSSQNMTYAINLITEGYNPTTLSVFMKILSYIKEDSYNGPFRDVFDDYFSVICHISDNKIIDITKIKTNYQSKLNEFIREISPYFSISKKSEFIYEIKNNKYFSFFHFFKIIESDEVYEINNNSIDIHLFHFIRKKDRLKFKYKDRTYIQKLRNFKRISNTFGTNTFEKEFIIKHFNYNKDFIADIVVEPVESIV